MGIRLVKSALASRQVRELVNGGRAKKLIDLTSLLSAGNPDENGIVSIVRGAFNLGRRLLGFALSVLNFGALSITAVVRFGV